jgi:DNA-binding transcriptional regulator YiaG
MATIGTREAEALELTVRLRDLRKRMSMSQAEFAERFGLGLMALKQWELQDRTPDRAAHTLIAMIVTDPDRVMSVLDRYNRTREEEQQLTAA